MGKRLEPDTATLEDCGITASSIEIAAVSDDPPWQKMHAFELIAMSRVGNTAKPECRRQSLQRTNFYLADHRHSIPLKAFARLVPIYSTVAPAALLSAAGRSQRHPSHDCLGASSRCLGRRVPML